jgi:hypothetical protein
MGGSSLDSKMQNTPEAGRKYAFDGTLETENATGCPSGSTADRAMSRSFPATTV